MIEFEKMFGIPITTIECLCYVPTLLLADSSLVHATVYVIFPT